MSGFLILTIYGIVSFFTGMSITFNILSALIDEDTLFKNVKSAIATYAVGICAGFLFTVISIKGVYIFQHIFA